MTDASHELRTPVSIIQGEADVVLARPDRNAEEYRASIEIMRKAALNLTRIVQNLFLLARSDAGNYPINKSRFYLDETLADCVTAMRSVAESKRIAVTCDSESDLQMFGDEELVRRLFLNLVENALKFTPEDGRINVRAQRDGDGYRVEVTDTGLGIPASDQAHVFERFFRSDHTRRRAPGAGLGLSIAKWIAELHGGSLRLTKSDSGGTTFMAELPIVTPGADEPTIGN
jgi:signal transduction histidine kinase